MRRNFYKIIAVVILLLSVIISCKKDKDVTGVVLSDTKITLSIGEMEALTAVILPSDATNKAVSWTSNPSDVAEVANGVVTAKEVGTATITVLTADGGYTATCVVTVTLVDAGDPETPEEPEEGVVINGVRWATRNVGVPGRFATTHQDAGMFYQWNRKIGWSAINPMINSGGSAMWNSSDTEGTTWENINSPCPSGWRVPTDAELQSLIDAGSEWITENWVTGRIFGSGNNTLFLPAAGSRGSTSGTLSNRATFGYYWSNQENGSADALLLYFNSASANMGSNYRSFGFSVRCVAE